jgi:hypothetical protein
MEHTNYFKEIDEKDDVKQELEDYLGEHDDKGDTLEADETLESKGRVVSEEGTYWGSSMKRRRVSSVGYGDDEEEKEEESHESNDNVESSPLFDRLQSLLVEVDGSDDEDENDDDDDLIASLPPFSTNEFIHGPSSSSGGGGNDVAHDNKEMIDVSALSLDQRTFIQLRAAGLINTKTHPSRVLKRGVSSSSIPENSDGESISLILQRMKSRLTSLQNESHVDIKTLQRKALLHVKQASERKQKEREDDAVLSKYRQLQKEQKEEKKRSSSRAKAGSNKFRDGEEWLPH